MTDSTDIGLRDEGGLVGPAGSATAVTVAGFGSNLLGYLVLLLAVHLLASSSYGQLVVLLNVLLVGTVPSFAVQTVTARRVATGDTAGMKQATLVVALTASVLLAVLSPALTAFLHLSSDIDLLLVAASLPAVTAMGMFQGVLQGERRFAALGMVLTAAALGRSACGLLGLLIARDATGAVLAILVGMTACACVVGVPLRGAVEDGPAGGPLREVGHALHAHGAFWFLSTLDVLLARHVLSSHLAAVYATGSVVTRGAIWLPQSVATLVFPQLTDSARHKQMLRRAVVIVAGVGAVVTLGVAALPTLVSRVVGGGRYPELVPSAWLFAMLGASLALLQLGMVAGLALRRTRQTAPIWAAIVADTVLVLASGSDATVGRVVATVAVITAVATIGSVLIGTGWLARSARPDQLAEPSGHAPGT